jgi:O-antigen/teichoic acid export membrane protein
LDIKQKYNKFKKAIIRNQVTSKIISNSSWLVSDKVFTMIIGVFITAIIARYFGPDIYGQFNYALAFVSLFTAIATLGLESLTIKSIVDKEYDEGTILCTSLFLRMFGGMILTILAGITIRLIEPGDHNLHLLVLIMSFSMTIKSFEVIEYWIQSYQKAKISSLINMCVYIISAILMLLLVFYHGNLIIFALIYLFNSIIISLALIISYYKVRERRPQWKFSLAYAKHVLSQSWYLILSGLMVMLYMRVDQVMIGYMTSNRSELGVFSAAVRIAEMWYFIPMALIVSLRPIIMDNKNKDELSYVKSVQLLYSIVAWMGIGFGVFISLFSVPIIKILYGVQYMEAASILSISVWAGTFAMLGSARSIWLICEGLQKYTLLYTLGGLLVNIILNIILIPKIGAYGAAIGTLASQFVANIVILYLFKETRVSSIMIIKAFIPSFIIKTN